MIVGFFVSLFAGALWLTFLYNSSGGSVMAVAIWHAGWNVANLAAPAFSPPTIEVLNGLMMVLGFGVLLVGPQHLSWSSTGRRVQES